jgi:LDH2 family malate/lactate/ureidoglycolate dehydrogenase
MAKKQTGESIRIPADLARKARVIASARGISLPEYLIEKLTPIVEEELPGVLRLLGLGSDEEKPPRKK